MIAPGTCNRCGIETDERFPIIQAGADCRPVICHDCFTNTTQLKTIVKVVGYVSDSVLYGTQTEVQ